MRTKEKLAQVLHGQGLLWMERNARDGRYDDFESESATPIADLVSDLRAIGQEGLAKRAINGEWDSTEAESEAWAASPDGQATIAKLTRRK